jgi:ethanolamine ammonia-lyase small subunit
MRQLRDFTMARVQLEPAGNGLATKEVLDFQLAHAAARDAVHHPFDVAGFRFECEARGWSTAAVRSAAPDRSTYLRRPDLGRRLGASSTLTRTNDRIDLAIVVADGLSALAVHRHTIPLLAALFPQLDGNGWSRSPLILVEQGRVAIGDEIGHILNAALALVLIGERPGLSSPDSLGAYITWDPKPGKTDAQRNCISNIRLEGLPYEQAAARIFALLTHARQRQLTGFALKEDTLLLPPEANVSGHITRS